MDKDVLAVEGLMKTGEVISEKKLKNNIENIKISYSSTRKTSISFVMLGMWTMMMPPYGLARLIGITRAAGFDTKVYDYNVKTYNYMRLEHPELESAWEVTNYWMWGIENFKTRILPYYQKYLDEYVEELLENKTDIIGFSCYSTNIRATDYVASRIRERSPETMIIYGGPECHKENYDPENADYFFVGESEQNILEFLENFENGILPPKSERKIGALFGNKRIDLDSLPYPDYSDFEMWSYSSKGAVTTELSRGCVARCTYCSEVYFWKFRDRQSKATVDEIEHLYNTYGIRYIYFADSLMNGNVKGFRDFIEELYNRKLQGLHWWGYARADARMDDEYFQLIKNSGGQGLNFGFETGSDKVLVAINKKNTVHDINSNIISAKKANIKVSALWVIGAPGEDIEGWAHSLNLVWNHKNRIFAMTRGGGLGDNSGTAYDDREKFNLNPRNKNWQGSWYTLDLKNTSIHRYLRCKMMDMWVDLCRSQKGTIENIMVLCNPSDHYNVEYLNTTQKPEVDYEFDFNYDIIKTDLGDFADSLMNEIFAFLRLLWRVKGGYKIHIPFYMERDKKDFENTQAMSNPKFEYNSDIHFEIDDIGNWQVNNSYKFIDNDPKVIGDQSFEYNFISKGKWNA